jgi:hypothetical protein
MRVDAGLNVVADFEPVPEVVYNLRIDEFEAVLAEGQENDLGKQVYNFTVVAVITDGEKVGKKINRRMTNKSEGSRYFMKKFLVGAGVPVEEDGTFDTDDAAGKEFSALVTIRNYKDKDGNEKKSNDIDADTMVAA